MCFKPQRWQTRCLRRLEAEDRFVFANFVSNFNFKKQFYLCHNNSTRRCWSLKMLSCYATFHSQIWNVSFFLKEKWNSWAAELRWSLNSSNQWSNPSQHVHTEPIWDRNGLNMDLSAGVMWIAHSGLFMWSAQVRQLFWAHSCSSTVHTSTTDYILHPADPAPVRFKISSSTVLWSIEAAAKQQSWKKQKKTKQ